MGGICPRRELTSFLSLKWVLIVVLISEVEELVAPRSETVSSVEKWLETHGATISERSSSGDWLHVTVPVARAEQMLNTRVRLILTLWFTFPKSH